MGLFTKIFGGSRSKNESGNLAYDNINKAYAPGMEGFGKGFGQAADVLGLNGSGASKQALDDYYKSSGGQFQLEEGLGDVNDKFHSLGLGRSGAAMKAMEQYRSDLASTKLNEYLGNIFNLNQQSLGAGGLVASAGQYSKGKGSNDTGAFGKFLGSLFSDRRLKTNIEKVGELPDGLGIYDYDYLPIEGQIAALMPEGRQRGVMADEVATLRPWALGPIIGGYATVNYAALDA